MSRPNASAITRLVAPAVRPFTIATNEASVSETLRVRLLSIAHARQAPSTASAGQTRPIEASPCQLSTSVPATISTMPNATRLSTFSRNTNQASSAVSTPSMFSSSEAVAAGIAASPVISSTGPSTPPASVAPASQPHSARVGRTGPACRTRRTSARPRPEPR